MTFISSASTGNPVINYGDRDYASILSDLLARIPTYLPEWTSQSESSFGVVLLEMFAYVGDILNYYLDRLMTEAFIQTATQPQSVYQLAAMLNYTATQTVGATVTLQITIGSSVVGPYTIPAGTQFQTLASSTTPALVFETDSSLTIAGSNGATPAVTGQVTATQGFTVSDEAVGTSTGAVNQYFPLDQSPVISGSLVVSVDIGTGPEEWTQTAHLINWGPNDLVYTTFVDPNGTLYVIFGDNVNGYVPPLGSPITATYRVGAGSLGNVGAGTIIEPVTALVGVVGVTNPQSATGGADPESLDSVRVNAPASITALNRAVTVNDVETLALQVPGVEWASAIEMTYQLVNLYIAPYGGGSPSSTLVSAIQNYLSPFLMVNTTVTVLDPTYVYLNLFVSVNVFPNFVNTATQQSVEAALADLLALSNTGFGMRVSTGLLYQTILAVPGVNWAAITSMDSVSLATALVSGTTYTSLAVSPLTQDISIGDTLEIGYGSSTTQIVTVSGNGVPGDQSIAVTSFVANAAYPVGSLVADTSAGVTDAILLSNEIPLVGQITVTASGGLIGS